MSDLLYRCPEPGHDRAPMTEGPDGLACPHGHVVPFAPGTTIPVFARQPDDANEYAAANAAEMHDNALQWVLDIFGETEPPLRERLAARLRLAGGERILVTGAGAGNDLPYLARALKGTGEIHAQDFAQQMLLVGAKRHRAAVEEAGVALVLSVSDAMSLPYADRTFDAAYHFGGINLFPDIATGIAEMDRLVKPGGRVVFGDEGLAPWLKGTEYGETLITNNHLYAWDIPLDKLPATARDVELTFELGNGFWVVAYTVSDRPLPLDLDVPHKGTRGGSLRTRFHGKLEGIDPALRDRVYEEAKRRGVSRVALLEKLLAEGLGEGK